MSQTEKARLESISNVSLYCAGVNSASIKYSFKIARRHMVGDTILELGPAEGVMTELLAEHRKEIDTWLRVQALFCDSLRHRFPDANYCQRSL